MKLLVYTSPARGHLYPVVPTLLELKRRGHEVAVRTLSSEVDRMRSLGFAAAALAPAIEQREIDDWQARSPVAALTAACRTFIERGQHEIGDLRNAIREERPDALYIDVNSWGATATAEASALPWAAFAPYFMPIAGRGIPPWGLGLRRLPGPLGHLRDAALWWMVTRLYDRALPEVNSLRAAAGVKAFRHVAEYATNPPLLLNYTAEPFEYPRAWPASTRLVGPGIWEPESQAAEPADADRRQLVLVTCSTEFQNDGRLIGTALDGLKDQPFRVVATTASIDPTTFSPPANATVERYLPHGPILAAASCVVCHGGMGITQKALAAGVPVCVVPFGRDQLEVARHVEEAGAGVRLARRRLTPETLRSAVLAAIARRPGAERIADAFRRAGGPIRSADLLEEMSGALKAETKRVARV